MTECPEKCSHQPCSHYWQKVLDNNFAPWMQVASRRYLEGCGVFEAVTNGPVTTVSSVS